jgi:hypothetical protein
MERLLITLAQIGLGVFAVLQSKSYVVNLVCSSHELVILARATDMSLMH